MISLIIAFLLFATGVQPDQPTSQYKIITTYESLYGNQMSGMVSQNGKITEEEIEPNYPLNYLFKKPGEVKTRFRVDSLVAIPLSQVGTYAGVHSPSVAGNDIQVEVKINQMVSQGWELEFVTSGAGGAENMGMLVTKYIFKRDH